MKKSRFSEHQMVKIPREAGTSPVTEAARKHGVSEQTIYLWRNRFGQYGYRRIQVFLEPPHVCSCRPNRAVGYAAVAELGPQDRHYEVFGCLYLDERFHMLNFDGYAREA